MVRHLSRCDSFDHKVFYDKGVYLSRCDTGLIIRYVRTSADTLCTYDGIITSVVFVSVGYVSSVTLFIIKYVMIQTVEGCSQ